MSDFLISIGEAIPEKKTNLSTVYCANNLEIAVNLNSLSSGCEVYEDGNVLCFTLGNPIILNQQSPDNQSQSHATITKALLNNQDFNVNFVRECNLAGAFAFVSVNKLTNEVTIINDYMAYIPIFYSNNQSQVVTSDINLLHHLYPQEIDNISLADMICNRSITYPYTIFKNVYQLAPASKHVINQSVQHSHYYWLPIGKRDYADINSAVEDLSKAIETYIRAVTKKHNRIGLFLSGGEDSRLLLAITKHYADPHCYTFVEKDNKESKIAKKVAKVYDADLSVKERGIRYYLENLNEMSMNSTMQHEFQHVHSVGYKQELQKNEVIIGGLYADAYFKGSRITTKNLSVRGISLTKKRESNKKIMFSSHSLIDKSIMEEVDIRRQKRLDTVKELTNCNEEEWFHLWPSSMMNSSANYYGQRKYLNIGEVFMCPEVLDISINIPTEWKINNDLYHRLLKKHLFKSRFVPNPTGKLPYYGQYFYLTMITKMLILIPRFFNKLRNKYPGPWTDWKQLTNTIEFKDLTKKQSYILAIIMQNLGIKDVNGFFNHPETKHFQMLYLIHLSLYYCSE